LKSLNGVILCKPHRRRKRTNFSLAEAVKKFVGAVLKVTKDISKKKEERERELIYKAFSYLQLVKEKFCAHLLSTTHKSIKLEQQKASF